MPRERRLLLSLETRPLGGSSPPLAALAVALGALPGPSLASPRSRTTEVSRQRPISVTMLYTAGDRNLQYFHFYGNVSSCVLTFFQRFPKVVSWGGPKKERTRAVSERERESERDMTVAAPQASEAGLQAAKEKAGVGDAEAPKEATPGAQEEGPAVDVGSAQALFDAVENNSEKDLEVRRLASPRLLCSTLTSPFSPHPRGLVLFFLCV